MTHPLWTMLFGPLLKGLALCGSIAGVALGVLLLARPVGTLAWMSRMNRWVSSRRALKALEIPRSAPGTYSGGRRSWLGLLLAVGGAYVVVALAWSLRATPFAAAFGKGQVTAIAVEAVRWSLVAGSALAVAVGLMMAFSPAAFERFARWSDRWISSRRALQGADTMHLPLDHLVERHPRPAGVLILLVSLGGVIASIVLISG